MGSATLNPNSVVMASGATRTGGSSDANALADGSDASYIQFAAGAWNGSYLVVGFDDAVIPAGAKITSMVFTIRYMAAAGTVISYTYEGPVLGGTGANATYTSGNQAGYFTSPTADAAVDALSLSFAGGSSNRLIGVSAAVVWNEIPVVTVTGPTGSQTSYPTITGTYNDPELNAMERGWWKVFKQADTLVGGFSPETSTPAYSSGEVYVGGIATPTSHTLVSPLPGGETYVPYFKAADAGSSGRYSNWAAGATFTVSTDVPSIPTIDATAVDLYGRVELLLAARENILTYNQSSGETDASGWTPGYNCTISSDAILALMGSKSIRVTRGAGSDNMRVTTRSPSLMAVSVYEGQVISAMTRVRAVTTARNCRIDLWFYAADQTTIVGSIAGSWIADTTSGWTKIYVTGTVPTGAVYVGVDISFGDAPIAASEAHSFDGVMVIPGRVSFMSEGDGHFTSDVITSGRWAAYHFSDSAPTVTRQFATDAPVSDYVLHVNVTSNTGFKGVSSVVNWGPFVPGVTYSLMVWMKSSVPTTVNLYVSGTGDPQTERSVGTDWELHVFKFTVTAASNGSIFIRDRGANHVLVVGAANIVVGAVNADSEPTFPTPRGPASDYDVWVPAGDWVKGGLWTSASQRLRVDRSSNAGATWEDITDQLQITPLTSKDTDGVTGFSRTQQGYFYDNSAPRGVALQYRARTFATDSNGARIVGSYSARELSAGLSLSGAGWTLKSITDPTLNILDLRVRSHRQSRKARTAIKAAFGRSTPLISRDVRNWAEGSLTVMLLGNAEYEALVALLDLDETLLLQSPDGEQWWISIMSDDIERAPSGVANPQRPVSLTYVGAKAP